MIHKTPFLLLHYYFPPLTGAVTKRVENIVKYLGTASSYEPVVVTSSPKLVHFGYDDEAFAQISSATSIYYTFSLDPLYLISNVRRRKKNKEYQSSPDAPLFSIARNFYTFCKNFFFIGDDKILLWTPFVLKRVSEIISNHPVRFIYTTFPPVGNMYAAYWLKKKFKLPLIIDYRDPWFYNSSALRYKTKLHFFFENICEKKILRETDGVIFNSPDTRDKYLQAYPLLEDKPTTVILNGYEEFRSADDISRPSVEDKTLKIVASGTMLKERSILPFLEILRKLLVEHSLPPERVACRICGVIEPSLKALLQSDPVYQKTVSYLGNLSYQEAMKQIEEADLTVACLNDPERDDIILNKLFDYMSRDKYILFIGNSKGSVRLLHDYGKSTCFDMYEQKKIACFLEEVINKPQEILHISRRVSPDKYLVENLMKKMGGFFDKIVNEKVCF